MTPGQMAARMSKLNAAHGAQVNFGGVLYNAVSIPDDTDFEYMPDGSRNAAWSDRRTFTFASTDFGTATPPTEGDSVTWAANGVVYQVTSGKPVPIGNSNIQWVIDAYRQPALGTSATNPTNQNGAW